MTSTIAFCFLLFFPAITTANNNGTTQLDILSLVEIVNGSVTWPACSAAVDIVVEAANANEQILPGYQLVIKEMNEGFNAMKGNIALLDFFNTTQIFWYFVTFGTPKWFVHFSHFPIIAFFNSGKSVFEAN